VAVQKKSCHQFIRTLIVRFIGGYSGIYDRGKRPFSPVTGAGAASILLGGEANSSLEERKSYWQRMWVRPTVCRLLALNVGSLAGIVSPGLPLLARNVSRKCPLFASSRATVCEPLQVATNFYGYGTNGNRQQETEFHRCVAFGDLGQRIAEFMTRGSHICVEGRLKTESWEHGDHKHYRTKIIVERTTFGTKKDRQTGAGEEVGDGMPEPVADHRGLDNDVPF
jgi:single-strand DNA-binding protein